MKIEPLPSDVRSYLRSGVAITSVTQCVEELVLNSLDAGATCVAVRVDLNCFKIQVVDNGSGVPNDQLEILGNRFYTSKCHSLTDLDNLCHFGYRGEALASIRDSCGIFEITTRSKLSSKTYCKIFQNGKSLKVAESTIVRPSVGTTITVHELFSNFPVRQKSMNKNFEIERIREMLEGIALIRPGISFTLRNDSTGQVILSTRKCVSINSTFGQLYGSAKADVLAEVRGSKQFFCIQGYIGREGHPRKNLQFVYVNGRLVKKSRIHKYLNQVLLNLPALKLKPKAPSNYSQMLNRKQNLFSSPPKFSEAYPVYILEVKCPISEYDITFEPAKTIVEFKDWDTLLTCVEEVTKAFLDKENIVMKTDEVEDESSKAILVKGNDKQNVPVISADNMKDVMSSKTVRKKTKQKNTEIVSETPDSRNSDEDKPGATTATSKEERIVFKTPANSVIAACKAAVGLGNRKLGVETDTEDTEPEIENSGKTSDNSITDESYESKTVKAKVVEEHSVKDVHVHENIEMPVITKTEGENMGSGNYTGHTAQCSLSKFRQSIGKFIGKPTKKVNIDESLKKLNRIMPFATKPTSRTLFSSLQKFRRKVECRNEVTAETGIEHEECFQEQEVDRVDKSEVYEERSENAPLGNYTGWMHKGDVEYINRNGANKTEGEFKVADRLTLNKSADNDKRYTGDSKGSSLECEQNEIRSSSQEMEPQLKFPPCYESINDACGHTDKHKFDSYTNSKPENEQICDNNVQPIETCRKSSSVAHSEILGIQKSGIYNMIEFQNQLCHQRQNEHISCTQECDDEFEHCDESDVGSIQTGRKRPFQESDISHEPEKHFKYTARLLDPTELNYNCDIDMCNKMSCDDLNQNHENIDFLEKDSQNCDKIVDPTITNDLLHFNTDIVTFSEKQFRTEKINAKRDFAVTNDAETDIDGELRSNEMDTLIDSTQAFSPRLSPQPIEVDRNSESGAIKVRIQTPESLGFTPKLKTESDTPGSTGFKPAEEIKCSIDISPKIDFTENKNSTNISGQDIEQNIPLHQKLQAESKADTVEVRNEKKLTSSEDKTMLDGTNCESVTLTQLLKTPSQKTDGERNIPLPESVEAEMDTECTVTKRKSFSFGDLFSQTPTCSINVETGMNEGKQNLADGAKPGGLSGTCSDSDLGMTYRDNNCCEKCTAKGDTLDIDETSWKSKIRHGTTTVGATVLENEEILWTDSPWVISDSSFYLREEINVDEKDVIKHDNQTQNMTDEKDKEESSRQDTVKVADDIVNFDEQDMNTLDSLNIWYQNLDAGISGASDILQSKKPSDVVRKLHTCRFSKESLKSVKVLGQLDKKFIACLINTEQQNAITDTSMLVLIDQHAAHERIRLEILTEEAFLGGVKGGQLAPFVVDPPQSMSFAEHEVRTILSFLDGYLKLGIKMKKDTQTSVLISSVPACLVDREKNNKIYWSTVQVLIREHIAVFMSTQVSCGVLPQTIHKVLCSLACHGAIKFGDRLAAEECVRLIKDLSRCDLPFQCAHGRPSVTPLFQMDKLQTLSHSKLQAKPKLWKLRQNMNMNPE